MTIRSVLTLAAFALVLGPAGAATQLALVPVDAQATQTPAQVFVKDANATVETDERGVVHGPGLRAPRPDEDPGAVVFNSTGDSLFFTLEKWRAGGGTAEFGPDPDGPGDRIALGLRRLIAFGHYSVAVRTAAPDGARFTPIDGSGVGNNFDAKADGSANVVVESPAHLASGSAVVVVYHSDGQDHGSSFGEFGRTAHQQLLVRVP